MKIFRVELGERSYPVYVETGALDKLGELYRKHELGRRAAIITDKTVEKLYGSPTLTQLKTVGVEAQLIPVPPGESSKSLEWLDRLYTRLIWAGFDRRSTLVALGGGVVGDLAGFVAATYLRGLPWVQIPTTLLAQVDAAIGGKTGINHRLGKNLIGAFYQPQFVLVDPRLLKTLLPRELWSGLAEVIKYGLICDDRLLIHVETRLREPNPLEDLQSLCAFVERSVEIKCAIVSQDEREREVRAQLNFGHTVGHALEAATKHQRFLHGEAVAWGMLAESFISYRRGWLALQDFERVATLLAFLPKPTVPADLAMESVLEYIHRDKKVRHRQIHVVLLQGLGKPVLCEVTETEIREALEYLQRFTRGHSN